MLCSALLQSHFDYAANCWFRGLEKRLKIRLQTCQNKIIRYIFSFHCRQHIGFKEFSKIGWLDVQHRIDYITLSHMYNVFSKTAPSYMQSGMNFVFHNYNTRRSRLAYVVPRVNTQGSHTFYYSGIKLWNDLPIDIKECSSREVFKKACKKHLFEKMEWLENRDSVTW